MSLVISSYTSPRLEKSAIEKSAIYMCHTYQSHRPAERGGHSDVSIGGSVIGSGSGSGVESAGGVRSGGSGSAGSDPQAAKKHAASRMSRRNEICFFKETPFLGSCRLSYTSNRRMTMLSMRKRLL